MHLGWLSGWPFAFLGARYTESPRVGIGICELCLPEYERMPAALPHSLADNMLMFVWRPRFVPAVAATVTEDTRGNYVRLYVFTAVLTWYQVFSRAKK
jgi:hypothetical protein